MIQPLTYLCPEAPHCLTAEDEFLLGDSLLVAPLLGEEQCTRTLYPPAGNWFSLFTGRAQAGGGYCESSTEDRFPVYIRADSALVLHLPPRMPLGTDVGNGTEPIHGLRLILAGEEGRYLCRTVPGQPTLTVRWERDTVELPPALSQAEVERWK